MRDILFRGKRKDGNSWVYGNLNIYLDINRSFIRLHAEKNEVKNTFELEVEKSTVGQYIGLLDKKDKRIFEGDIVHVKAPGYSVDGIVTWDSESASFRIVVASRDEDDWSEFMWQQECYEVVGNIHDSGGTKA